MCLIEKLSDLGYIRGAIPGSSNCWINQTMPDIYLFYLGISVVIEILGALTIINKYLIIKIHIWIETRESLSLFFYLRYGYISDEDSPYER
jgi:hypothetical protein